MSTATLLHYPDTTHGQIFWGFDHQQDHRIWVSVWAGERQGYCQLPYVLEHVTDTPDWRMRHDQAHLDTVYSPPKPVGPFAPPLGQNIRDSGPSNPQQRAYWSFMNHTEHQAVAQNMAAGGYDWYFPF